MSWSAAAALNGIQTTHMASNASRRRTFPRIDFIKVFDIGFPRTGIGLIEFEIKLKNQLISRHSRRAAKLKSSAVNAIFRPKKIGFF